MGTGPFALEALKALYETYGKSEGTTLSVYTKEDKPSGRGMAVKRAAVVAFAEEKKLPLYQPKTLREPEAQKEFFALSADLAIVASYGLILPKEILCAPKYGCVNIHASLLPRYRGAAPINRCILNGEEETGVTIMQMDEGLDTGDMLMKKKIAISPDEDCGSLFDRLAVLGSQMILEAIPRILQGEIVPEKQDHEKSTYAEKITSADQRIDWTEDTKSICNRIRALSPFPGAICRTADGKILKIYAARSAASQLEGEAGEVVSVKPQVLVKTIDGAIELLLIQPEGKPRMRASDLVNGRKIALGDKLS